MAALALEIGTEDLPIRRFAAALAVVVLTAVAADRSEERQLQDVSTRDVCCGVSLMAWQIQLQCFAQRDWTVQHNAEQDMV